MTPKELATQFMDDLAQGDMSRDYAIALLTNRIILLAMDYQAAAIAAERAQAPTIPANDDPERALHHRRRTGLRAARHVGRG